MTVRGPAVRQLLPRWPASLRGNAALTIAGIFVFLVAILAIFGPLLAPHDPNAQHLDIGVTPPSAHALFGTDSLGRDILSRTLAGARSAVIGPLLIAIGTAVISLTLGIYSGYRGGMVDAAIMRGVDLAYATPPLLLVVVVVGVLQGGYFVAVLVLTLISAPYDIRVVRAVTLEQRALPYVEAARTLGLSRREIMFRHLAPNVVPFVIVNSCLEFAFGLVTLSALSFLGLGVPPGTADWGRMLDENRAILFTNGASVLAPGIVLVLTAAAVNLLGDALGERLARTGLAEIGEELPTAWDEVPA
jgi:peptide/nickel transport system permease protein